MNRLFEGQSLHFIKLVSQKKWTLVSRFQIFKCCQLCRAVPDLVTMVCEKVEFFSFLSSTAIRGDMVKETLFHFAILSPCVTCILLNPPYPYSDSMIATKKFQNAAKSRGTALHHQQVQIELEFLSRDTALELRYQALQEAEDPSHHMI